MVSANPDCGERHCGVEYGVPRGRPGHDARDQRSARTSRIISTGSFSILFWRGASAAPGAIGWLLYAVNCFWLCHWHPPKPSGAGARSQNLPGPICRLSSFAAFSVPIRIRQPTSPPSDDPALRVRRSRSPYAATDLRNPQPAPGLAASQVKVKASELSV